MTGKHRIEFPGALCHVFSRGNNKGDIFLDDKDYNVFLKKLREVQEEKPFYLYGYCLMPNHFHLLLGTIDEPLSKIMQMLLRYYALYFNSRYEKVGHLFQSRYKSIICENERYLFKLLQYIHINPVEAGLVKDINDYKWSSHQYYIGQKKNENLSIERLFKIMDVTLSGGYNLYRNLLNEKLDIKIKGNVFGTKDFIKKIKNENIKPNKSSTEKIKIKTLSEILAAISDEFKLPQEVILSDTKAKDISYARKIFLYKSAKEHGYKLKEISDFINRDITVIDKHIRSIKKELKKKNCV